MSNKNVEKPKVDSATKVLAQMIVDHTHDQKNNLAVLSAATHLVDDYEAQSEMRGAVHGIQRYVERLKLLSMVTLDKPLRFESIELNELLRLTINQARREGCSDVKVANTVNADDTYVLCIPITGVTRLFVDLIHSSNNKELQISVKESKLIAEVNVGDTAKLSVNDRNAFTYLAEQCNMRMTCTKQQRVTLELSVN